eukprot:SAG31_NODE_8792_length_1386_cov_1.449883_2_plen_91_part_00
MNRYRRRLHNRIAAERRIAEAYKAEEADKQRKRERTINGVGRMRRDWENTIKERERRMCRSVAVVPIHLPQRFATAVSSCDRYYIWIYFS